MIPDVVVPGIEVSMNLVSWGLWVTLMDGLVVLTWVTIRVVGEICQTLAYSLCPPHPSSLKDTHP